MPKARGLNLGNILIFVDGRDEGGETTDGWEEDDDLEPDVLCLSAELSFCSTIIKMMLIVDNIAW